MIPKSAIPITPREVAEAITSNDFQQILKEYELPADTDNISYHRLYGGIRNAVFLVKKPCEWYVLTIYKPSPTAQGRVKRNLEIYRYLRSRNFPVPEVVTTCGGDLYLRRELLGVERFVSCHRYLGGRKIFPHGKREISRSATMLAKIHLELAEFPHRKILHSLPVDIGIDAPSTVLHMDFARGNILFTEEGEISAVLDFEAASWGPPIVDIAKSLAIISKDNEELPYEDIKSVYLENYQQQSPVVHGFDLLDNLVDCFKPDIV